MKTVNTFNLKLASNINKAIKVNLHFSLEGKKLIKDNDDYLSYVNYPANITPGFVDFNRELAFVTPSRKTGKVLFKSFNLIGTIKTKYKDTGNIQYPLIYGEYITRGTLEEVDTYLVKTSKTVLTILSGGKMSLTIDGKLLTGTEHIRVHLACVNQAYNLNISLTDYYLSRSPKIQRTSWEKPLMDFYYNNTFDRIKKSVYRKVYKNDIKGATAALLWHPQASKAVVKKVKELLNTRNVHFADELPSIRNTLSTIKLKDPQGFNNFSLQVLNQTQSYNKLFDVIFLGAMFPNIANSLLKNSDYSFVNDTCDAYYRLKEEGYIFDTDFELKSIKQLHDTLTERVVELKDVKSGLVRLPTLNELPIFSKNGYTIKNVNAHDLPGLGEAMSICVGMYKRVCWLGTVNISAVYGSSGKPIACLEWYYGEGSEKGYLVQAKLFANKKVYTDNTILDLVFEWCKLNNILIYTRDMGSTFTGTNDFLPPKPDPLEERQELLRTNKSSSGYGIPF